VVEPADWYVVPDLAKVLRTASRVGETGVHAVVVDAGHLHSAVLVVLALALKEENKFFHRTVQLPDFMANSLL
jgi:hypothetical protein